MLGEVTLSKKEQYRIEVMEKYIRKEIKVSEAAKYIKLSVRQCKRLKKNKYGDMNGQVFSKHSQNKQAVKCPDDYTETQWAHARSLFRFWNSGKIRWEYVRY